MTPWRQSQRSCNCFCVGLGSSPHTLLKLLTSHDGTDDIIDAMMWHGWHLRPGLGSKHDARAGCTQWIRVMCLGTGYVSLLELFRIIFHLFTNFESNTFSLPRVLPPQLPLIGLVLKQRRCKHNPSKVWSVKEDMASMWERWSPVSTLSMEVNNWKHVDTNLTTQVIEIKAHAWLVNIV